MAASGSAPVPGALALSRDRARRNQTARRLQPRGEAGPGTWLPLCPFWLLPDAVPCGDGTQPSDPTRERGPLSVPGGLSRPLPRAPPSLDLAAESGPAAEPLSR